MTDLGFLKEAYSVAIDFSTDPSTQNGAILVEGGGYVAFGANHFPRGVQELPERWERPGKYQYVEHAERNCIYDAARYGVRTEGLIMYCPWFACTDCARAIIQAGIKEVVGHDTPLHDNPSQVWSDSIKVAYTMLDEAGVKMRHVPGIIGLKIRFNGVLSEV